MVLQHLLLSIGLAYPIPVKVIKYVRGLGKQHTVLQIEDLRGSVNVRTGQVRPSEKCNVLHNLGDPGLDPRSDDGAVLLLKGRGEG
jgi:hypothetical protein